MSEIDITRPVETVSGMKVVNLRRRAPDSTYWLGLGAPAMYPLIGEVGGVQRTWTSRGTHDSTGRTGMDIRNVVDPAEIDWSKPGILNELQFSNGRAHPFTRVVATDIPGGYPVLLWGRTMLDRVAVTAEFAKDGSQPRLGLPQLMRKPRKVTRTLYFAKAHIDALEKGKSQYLNNSPGDAAVKVEYTI